MMTEKTLTAIDMNYDAWSAFFEHLGQPSYRAGQVCAWIWKRGTADPQEMTDLAKSTREDMEREVDFFVPKVVHETSSRDGTRKFLIELHDFAKIETVLLKQGDRLTACISTQVGCPVGCPFCFTGEAGFERSLSRGEIAYQLILMEKQAGREINNVVLMGMGEPFLNIRETLDAVSMLNDPRLRGLGIRHITLSTAGIIPGIEALAESKLGVRLAVSLHAVDDDLRDELVPCNTAYPVSELLSALKDYQRITGDRITIEYALFRSKNDTLEHARELVRALKGIHVYINLIPSNSTRSGYERSDERDVLRFQSVLRSAGFESEIRTERGADITAACGQLKGAGDIGGQRPDKAKTGSDRHKEREREPAPRSREENAASKRAKPVSGRLGKTVRPEGDSGGKRHGRDDRLHSERDGVSDIRRRKGPPGRGRRGSGDSGKRR